MSSNNNSNIFESRIKFQVQCIGGQSSDNDKRIPKRRNQPFDMIIICHECFHSLKVQKKVVVVVSKIHWMIIKFVCTKASKMTEFYEMFAFFISANSSIFLLITNTLRTQRSSENWNKKKKKEIKPLWQKCVSHDFIDVSKYT